MHGSCSGSVFYARIARSRNGSPWSAARHGGATVSQVEQRRPDLRFPFPDRFVERLSGRRILALGRRAKYLTIHLNDGLSVISHLGMSGSFRIETDDDGGTPGEFHHERSKLSAHDHVVFHLLRADGAPARIVYNDPRRFGFMLLRKKARSIATRCWQASA